MPDPHDLAILGALVILGRWLETINGKHGWIDELLAPMPLAFAGLIVLTGERFI